MKNNKIRFLIGVQLSIFFLCIYLWQTGYGYLWFSVLAILSIPILYRLLYFYKERWPVLLKHIIRAFTVFILFGISIVVATGILIGISGAATPSQDCDYIIILGCKVNGTNPSQSLRERLDTAVVYLSQHPRTTAIVSGGKGSGEDIAEAECMYNYLIGQGISSNRIWKEENATRTQENIAYTKELILHNTGKDISELGIVSSEYHLFRAGIYARNFGFEPFGIPAKTRNFALRLNYTLREIAGVWHYIILEEKT